MLLFDLTISPIKSIYSYPFDYVSSNLKKILLEFSVTVSKFNTSIARELQLLDSVGKFFWHKYSAHYLYSSLN
jgi:hypothetical protein